MSQIVKVQIGDAEFFVPTAVAREIDGLRGANAALTVMARDGAPVRSTAASAPPAVGTSLIEDERAKRAPGKGYGEYIRYLENAHREQR